MERRPEARSLHLPRIAIGGILHETNSFVPGRTRLADFEARVYLQGDDIVDAGTGTDSALGGVIEAATGQATLVPLVFASAMPGPPVEAATFEALAGDLLARLRQAAHGYPRLRGVVLLLHGAMITDNDHDPEGTLLERVRDMVGPTCPVIVVLDSHATVSARMVAAATRIAAYQTYPHLDTRIRGIEAMAACLDHVAGKPPPAVAHRKLPLLMPLLAQATEPGTPMGYLLERADAWRSHPGISSVSQVPGFPYADVEDAGASVLVYAEGGQSMADEAANDLAECWWDLREQFLISGAPPEDLLQHDTPGVTIVADIADNPGAGATSRDTSILRFFQEHDLQPAAFACLVDPAAVAACHLAGTGALVSLAVGDPRHGEQWRIDHLGDGVFTHRGPMATGATNRIGRTATVSRAGISVILCERRVQVVDPAVFPACGIAPDGCRWLVVKSSVHFRAAFREIATGMIEIEALGPCSSDLSRLSSRHMPRPIWPLDREAGWASIGSVERCIVE